MKRETIKRHIDNRIIKDLPTMGPDALRQDLALVCTKFRKNITEHPRMDTVLSIENIKDVRSRYLSLYIYFAQQRIIDLYKVEIRDIYGWPVQKKFKALLFKEKLEGKY
jgi:ABC-type transporter lipoprotein component MlaA